MIVVDNKYGSASWSKIILQDNAATLPISWTYVVQSGNGKIKIGQTMSPDIRFRQLNNIIPLSLSPMILFDSRVISERCLHSLFQNERYKGEWFHPSNGLMSVYYNPESFLLEHIHYLTN